jgi:hypothetical protein
MGTDYCHSTEVSIHSKYLFNEADCHFQQLSRAPLINDCNAVDAILWRGLSVVNVVNCFNIVDNDPVNDQLFWSICAVERAGPPVYKS